MRQAILVGPFFLLAATVTGCARLPVKAPEALQFSLGGVTAPTRDYAGTGKSVCRVDREMVAQETGAMNALLQKWLEQTSPEASPPLSDEQLQLLETGAQQLPPVLAYHQWVLAELATCPPDGEVELTEVVGKGQQLVPQAKARVEAAPQLLSRFSRATLIAEWKAKELAAQKTEHSTWCPATPRLIADIFYAWQDETGRTEWLFCDGNRVVAEPGGQPVHVPAEGYNPKRRGGQTPEGFLAAARRFPDSEIRRPPESAPKQPAPQPASGEPAADGSTRE